MGRYLSGGGDGMSDSIPATINNKQPARLADGEFVVPADVVADLGNGSSNAGAKKLYAMMKGQIAGLMKQAQQMQEKMKRAQEELNALELTGQAAGGLVKATISGKYEVKRVQIDPAAMDDREMLEDLVVTAYTDAFKQAEAASQALMSGATAGMPMPPGFKLPF